MSIALIVTGGFGNGNLIGDIGNVTTRGYLDGVGVVVSPACANIVITRTNTASMGLLAANVATPVISLVNVSTISIGALNDASMTITRANTATISITECN